MSQSTQYLRSVVPLAMFTDYICESSSNHPMDVQLEQIHLLIHHRDNSYYQVRGLGPNDDKMTQLICSRKR